MILRAPPLSIISGPERGRFRLNVKFSDDVSVITASGAEKIHIQCDVFFYFTY